MTVADVDHAQGRADWRDLIDAQAGSLAPLWDNAEDEVWNDA